MSASFRSIANIMDPVQPPTFLRALIAGHRWVDPHSMPLSYRSVFDRHQNPNGVIRFLSYNTYLLPGVEIPLGSFIDNVLGWGAVEIFTGQGITGKVLSKLGITNRVCSLLPFPTDKICEAVGDPIGFVLNELGISPEELVEELGLKPSQIISQLTGKDISSVRIAPKPALDARALELGPQLAKPVEIAPGIRKRFEVMALSEAWTGDARSKILGGLGNQPPVQSADGPDASGHLAMLGSGLMVITVGRPIRQELALRHVFDNRGDRLRETDAWANKGVMRTAIDVGVGFVELYSTHLFSGGDLITVGSSESDLAAVRFAQLGELLALYRANHNPQNVCIITGDFNINAKQTAEYGRLLSVMPEFEDIWPRWNSMPIERATHDTEAVNHDLVCQSAGFGSGDPYCNTAPPPGDYGCLDYIFVEKPTNAHTFDLDVSRVRRLPFRRSTTQEIGYLSDHLGLETTLVVSARPK